jgi:hypothetical protein
VTPPVLLVPKATAAVAFPLQTVWFDTALTCPRGFTTTLRDTAVPGHAVAPGPVGVIVYVTVTGAV